MSQTEKSEKKKREKSNSAEMTTGRHRQVQSASYTKGSLLQQPQQAAAAAGRPVIDHSKQPQAHSYYYPTPAPETVIVHSVPKKTNDACCWGCFAAFLLCLGAEECCCV